MSLVSGLLNKTCDILRPVFSDDGSGGETISSYNTIATNVEVLISQNQSFVQSGDGGRVMVQKLTAYLEYADDNSFNLNDVITNVRDMNTGVMAMDVIDGVSTPSAWKLKSPNDPNLEGDHLEFDVEQVHGRSAGQP